MANQEQLDIVKQGPKSWNKWCQENISTHIDLSNADLSRSDFRHADLNRADLTSTNFQGADLSYANLRGVDLSYADLSHANLNGAGIRGSVLRGTNLFDASLSKVDFRGALIELTNFTMLDLSETLGLEKVKHDWYSSIDTHTLRLSKGNIPEAFLRGCGLPDWEIESAKLHNPDLTNEEIVKIQYRIYELRATQALQISPLFISYSHVDSVFVDKLEKGLNEKGIRFWRDIHLSLIHISEPTRPY